jgi:DNA-binding protein Fis
MNELFQQITASYYLIPNIEKYLNRILEIINDDFPFISSIIYYTRFDNEIITIQNFSKKNSFFSNDELFDISRQIFTDNFTLITYTKRIIFNQNLEAYILPIYYQLIHFGIIIFFNINGTSTLSDELIDSIRIYITAACIGNHLITSNQNTLQKYIHTGKSSEISLKKLFEWRIKEIINNAIKPLIHNKGLYHEISRETERVLIKAALNCSDDNLSKASRILGINRNTLRKKKQELEIF